MEVLTIKSNGIYYFGRLLTTDEELIAGLRGLVETIVLVPSPNDRIQRSIAIIENNGVQFSASEGLEALSKVYDVLRDKL